MILAALTAAKEAETKADIVFDENYVPVLKEQGSKVLLLSMAASPELQRAFQRLRPGNPAFISTSLSFS